jgi:hypothetical protein
LLELTGTSNPSGDRNGLDRTVLGYSEPASEARLVVLVSLAARSDWRAAKWMLETRWPER